MSATARPPASQPASQPGSSDTRGTARLLKVDSAHNTYLLMAVGRRVVVLPCTSSLPCPSLQRALWASVLSSFRSLAAVCHLAQTQALPGHITRARWQACVVPAPRPIPSHPLPSHPSHHIIAAARSQALDGPPPQKEQNKTKKRARAQLKQTVARRSAAGIWAASTGCVQGERACAAPANLFWPDSPASVSRGLTTTLPRPGVNLSCATALPA